jgi:hypothetical protein
MSLFKRLRYALYLSAVGGALVILLVALGSADVIGLLPIAAFDMLFNPLYAVVLYVIAFVAAPWLADRIPIARAAPRSGE